MWATAVMVSSNSAKNEFVLEFESHVGRTFGVVIWKKEIKKRGTQAVEIAEK